ncbi:hypothetical protein GH714_011314 [Hevea brasiliensis]|uniref:Uncharacterized protein n=1 Tax=Hevea brasiliensis TaxID=3981 RepID=A0A6A6L438_HEVBR|nr:hypothetical protein GH714_011314 [Hevea brasiliensis]
MGICSSCGPSTVATAKLILEDGRLEEFQVAVRVSQILQRNPSCFICNADDLGFDDHVSAINDDEELELGQLYFELPVSWLDSPIKAEEIAALAVKASSAVDWCSESMYVNCRPPQAADDEELQLGQIYFLMPLSKSHAPLSLQELCALAIKASSALAQPDTGYPSSKTLPYLRGNGQRFCKISIGFDIVGANFRQSGAAGKLSAKIQ